MKNKNLYNSRRNFLKNAGLLGAISTVAPQLLNTQPSLIVKDGKVEEGFTFLFQGDSITDGNRSRDNDWNHVMAMDINILLPVSCGMSILRKGFISLIVESAVIK